MLAELTGDDLYAELIMLRSNDSRYFVVVEGVADVAVFDRFADLSHCVPTAAYGKESAHTCLKRVIADGFDGVFAILDRDWVDLLPGDLQDEKIVHTDYYDLDSCIFFSEGTYEGMASSFCAGGGFRVGANGCTARELQSICVEMAFPVGVLRFISERDSLGLNLGKFPLSEVIGPDFKVDLESLLRITLSRTKGNKVLLEDISVALHESLKLIKDKARYCAGHDLAKAFSILIKKRWNGKIGADVVERSARSSLDVENFKKMSIYSDARKWAEGSGKPIWRI
ncbi:hypothetical protein OG508_21345 [Streptomyces sp. NBC_01108]|uniref:hypothetical protein n=1 Tax=Streptomyces sp. NBC_01108 TaxID=2903751 RepID=UPI003873013C|nr:hypothetical protein OG508_21345 [Streptomyces sp. NBC_01108]